MSEGFGNIYVTGDDGSITAFEQNGNGVRWAQTILSNRVLSGTVTQGSYVVVGDFEGYLHWLNQETGEIVARHEVDASGIESTPTVVDSVLYTQSRDGDLQAISTPKIVTAEK